MSEENILSGPLEKGVQFLYEAGEGAEASVSLELRRVFPGIGYTISTEQDLATAYRVEKCHGQGHRRFLLHTVIKKLEDYYFRIEKYGYAHITRPLGSTTNGYFYEWADGNEGFAWEHQNAKEKVVVNLEDWNTFVGVFNQAGIDMTSDITDCDDGKISKNIIHKNYRYSKSEENLNRLWKRIDFGGQSLRVDYEKLKNFLKEKKLNLIRNIGLERYQMIFLATEYLIDKNMEQENKSLLEILVGNYRLSTLRHLNARGFEPRDSPLVLGQGKEL